MPSSARGATPHDRPPNSRQRRRCCAATPSSFDAASGPASARLFSAEQDPATSGAAAKGTATQHAAAPLSLTAARLSRLCAAPLTHAGAGASRRSCFCRRAGREKSAKWPHGLLPCECCRLRPWAQAWCLRLAWKAPHHPAGREVGPSLRPGRGGAAARRNRLACSLSRLRQQPAPLFALGEIVISPSQHAAAPSISSALVRA